jgi:hypothetical protein
MRVVMLVLIMVMFRHDEGGGGGGGGGGGWLWWGGGITPMVEVPLPPGAPTVERAGPSLLQPLSMLRSCMQHQVIWCACSGLVWSTKSSGASHQPYPDGRGAAAARGADGGEGGAVVAGAADVDDAILVHHLQATPANLGSARDLLVASCWNLCDL